MRCSCFRPLLYSLPETSPARRMHHRRRMQKKKVVAPVSPEAKETPADSTVKEEVFMVAEQMPEYPGGMKEMLKFLQENVKYPENAMKNNVQGRVIVQFVVEKDGTPTEFKVLRSVDPDWMRRLCAS